MAIKRLTVPKTVWAKLQSKVEKGNKNLGSLLAITKSTKPPGGDVVLWEPAKELTEEMAAVLIQEETFTRKPGSCSHKAMLSTIKQLQEFHR